MCVGSNLQTVFKFNFFLVLYLLKMIVVMVDKMLKTQIVECASVIKWIFSDSLKDEFNSNYLWRNHAFNS